MIEINFDHDKKCGDRNRFCVQIKFQRVFDFYYRTSDDDVCLINNVLFTLNYHINSIRENFR